MHLSLEYLEFINNFILNARAEENKTRTAYHNCEIFNSCEAGIKALG